jgi:hypothetical protein
VDAGAIVMGMLYSANGAFRLLFAADEVFFPMGSIHYADHPSPREQIGRSR